MHVDTAGGTISRFRAHDPLRKSVNQASKPKTQSSSSTAPTAIRPGSWSGWLSGSLASARPPHDLLSPATKTVFLEIVPPAFPSILNCPIRISSHVDPKVRSRISRGSPPGKHPVEKQIQPLHSFPARMRCRPLRDRLACAWFAHPAPGDHSVTSHPLE